MEDKSWDRVLSGVHELAEEFPEGMVLIGGVAVWFHSKKLSDERLLMMSHDVDCFLSTVDFGTLREYDEVIENRRLGKFQVIRSGVDFDIYVERRNGLVVPYEDVQRKSVVLDGVRCASTAHLLVLKIEAYMDRKTSVKGHKDALDIIKILMLIATQYRYAKVEYEDIMHTSQEGLDAISGIAKDSALYYEISKKNRHDASIMRKLATDGLKLVLSSYSGTSTDSADPSHGVLCQ